MEALFEEAVAAIDAGDETNLQRLIACHPELVCERLEAPGPWIGPHAEKALDGFFHRPCLLWFVAEDPERNGSLPPNIAALASIIIDAVRARCPAALQEQVDAALRMVAWSGTAARCGVQLDLLDTLIDAGALPARNADNALVNGHMAAARLLIERGGEVTLGSALCLGRWDFVSQLAAAASPGARQFAFVLAALNGRADALLWMVRHGTPVDLPSADLFSHATPLHHAVCSGSLDAVQALVASGANPDTLDTAWNGTPLGWAEHYVATTPPGSQRDYPAIAAYLRRLADSR